jgi:hypothetical protein
MLHPHDRELAIENWRSARGGARCAGLQEAPSRLVYTALPEFEELKREARHQLQNSRIPRGACGSERGGIAGGLVSAAVGRVVPQESVAQTVQTRVFFK